MRASPRSPDGRNTTNGSQPGKITKRLWDYIKKIGLRDKLNKRLINADEKLKKIFGGKSAINTFEMTKHVSKHSR